MPTVTLATTIAATTTVQNIYDGIRAAKVPNIAGSKWSATYLSTAANAVDFTEEVFVGSSNPVELSIVSGADRVPQSPEDIVTTFPVNPGEEITLRVTNANVAALVHFSKLVLSRLR